jgi:altronate dehydratase large subunit
MGAYPQPREPAVEKMNEITGFRRNDGKVGIRNHVLVLPTVSCVNGVASRIGKAVPEAVAVTHGHGCGRGGPRDIEILFRILTGMMKNPNVGAVVLIGLGCEVSNVKNLAPMIADTGKPITILNVQEDGGSLKTAAKGIEAAKSYVAALGAQKRQPIAWEELLIAIECGGSDAMSGVTANVAMGAVSDWLVDRGATVMFGENTEMIGTAHVLARRAKDRKTGEEIEKMVDRAEVLTRDIMGELASLVISPGNMDGGMSSIAEKSMGCIVKGGTSVIHEVVDYGAVPARSGLVLQDGPGYDADSMSGFAASGAQLMFFSTGRGTPAGFPTVPVIKVASNSRVYRAMEDDIDVNAGLLVEGKSLGELREEMIERMVRVINGEPTKPEANDMGVFTFMTIHPPF